MKRRRSRSASGQLRAVLNRKDPAEIKTAVGERLENSRQSAIDWMGRAAEAERAILAKTLDATDPGSARASRLRTALAAADSDKRLSQAAREAAHSVPRPSKGGILMVGRVVAGSRGMPADAKIVFVDSNGAEIDDAPSLKLNDRGEVAEALDAAELKRLAAAAAERGGARFAVKVGERVRTVAPKPVRLTPGRVLRFGLTLE